MVMCFVDAVFKPATSSIADPTILYRCLDISTIFQNLIYILPVEIFDKRRKQGVYRVERLSAPGRVRYGKFHCIINYI